MGLRGGIMMVLVAAVGGVVAACGAGSHGSKNERRYVKICTQYIGDKYANADDLCRCQWKAIKAEVPREDMDEFFLKLTAGRRFETKASRMIDRISARCLAELGGKQ